MGLHDDSAAGRFAAGDLVSIVSGDGDYGVVKLLVTDAIGVHVRLYQQRFPDRPSDVDPATLSLGPSMFAQDVPFSIGHIPLCHETFAGWQPVLMARGIAVEDRELQGYRGWEEAEGGYF